MTKRPRGEDLILNDFLFKRAKLNEDVVDEIADYKQSYKEQRIITIDAPKKKYPTQLLKHHNLKGLLEYRKKHCENCPIWSEEVLNDHGKKYYKYYLMDYSLMSKFLKKKAYPRFNECFEGPSKLVIDIDIDNKESFNVVTYESALKQTLNLLDHINIHLLKGFKIKTNIDLQDPIKSDVLILDSSRKGKVSFHVIYKKVVFLNIAQVGIYMSKILCLAIDDKINIPDLIKGDPPNVDLKIYTERHFLRTYFSVKGKDSNSRLVVLGPQKQIYNEETFKESLVNYFESDKLDVIVIEQQESLTFSYHYTVLMNKLNNGKKTFMKPRKNMMINTSVKKKSMQNTKKCFVDFFNFCNKEFKREDKRFDCSDYKIEKVHTSNFGSTPFKIPNSEVTIVRGQSFCLTVVGRGAKTYCFKHKRYHESAKMFTYYYFPYSDNIKSERKQWRMADKKKLVIPKKRIRNNFIFNLYYRCNFRDTSESCEKIRIMDEKGFQKIHEEIMKEICKN